VNVVLINRVSALVVSGLLINPIFNRLEATGQVSFIIPRDIIDEGFIYNSWNYGLHDARSIIRGIL